LKDERVRASAILNGPTPEFKGDKQEFIDNLEQALYASKIISYAQGFMLIQNAAKEYSWKLNKPEIALMWRGGCIIRSVFLKDITKAYRSNPDLENLLFDDFFNKAIHKAQPGWRDIVSKGALWGIPTPAFSTALSFFDGYRTKNLPANLLQAQRDYFGAHTFRMKPEDATESKPEKTVSSTLNLQTVWLLIYCRISTSTGPVVVETSVLPHTLHRWIDNSRWFYLNRRSCRKFMGKKA
jgi:6-phosphogluconate dehydrogenase